MKMKVKKSILLAIISLITAFVGILFLNFVPKLNDDMEKTVAVDTNSESSYWIDLYDDFETYSLSGAGTEELPFLIQSEKDLVFLSWSVYNNKAFNGLVEISGSEKYFYNGKFFKQTKDLDLSGYYWQPIGIGYDRNGQSANNYFSGSYDGDNFKISGLNTPEGFTSAYNYQGLFGCVATFSIENEIIIQNLKIDNSNIKGYNGVGGFIGSLKLTNSSASVYIKNCENYATVIGDDRNIGGIIGEIRGSSANAYIENCTNYGNINGYQDRVLPDYLGGIVGYSDYNPLVEINNCKNKGKIEGSNIGGILGSGDALISNCGNEGDITGSNLGGIVGNGEKIKNCYNSGTLMGSENVGGIAGGATEIVSCYNEGQITAVGIVGGIVGVLSNGVMNLCYNNGDINILNFQYDLNYIGGLVGYFETNSSYSIISLNNSYNAGSITSEMSSEVIGGVIGCANYDRRGQQLIINNVYNKGSFITCGEEFVGGVIGEISFGESSILELTNTFNISYNSSINFGSYFGETNYQQASAQINLNYNYFGGENFSTTTKIVGDQSINIVTGITYLQDILLLAKTKNWYLSETQWKKNFIWDFDMYWKISSETNDGFPVLACVTESGDVLLSWQDIYDDLDTYQLEGKGTKANPYLIQSEKDLTYLAYTVNNNNSSTDDIIPVFEGCYFEQTKNIDLSGYIWEPIGNVVNSSLSKQPVFAGNYNGKNFSIYGMKGFGDEVAFGLFGMIYSNNSYFENIVLENSIIINYLPGAVIAGLAGYAMGGKIVFSNCVNKNNISGLGTVSAGIVAYASATDLSFINCVNYGNIYGLTSAGISGMGNIYFECTNYGDVYGTQGSAGISYQATGLISYCKNYGNITGIELAGIVYNAQKAVANCINYGTISGSGDLVAGIVGMTTSTVAYCSNYGTINASSMYLAGIVSNLSYNGSDNAYVSNCSNSGDITCISSSSYSSNNYVAGIIAYGKNISIRDCFNAGSINNAVDNSYTAGIAGAIYSYYLYICYNKGNITSISNVGGIAGIISSDTILLNTFNAGQIINSNTGSNSFNLGAIVALNNGADNISYSYYGANCDSSINPIGNQETAIANVRYLNNLDSLVTDESWLTDANYWGDCSTFAYLNLDSCGFELNVSWEKDLNLINDGYPILKDYFDNNLAIKSNRSDSFSGGDGSQENPYLISSVEDFGYFVYLIESEYVEGTKFSINGISITSFLSNTYFKITQNLDFKGYVINSIGVYNNSSVKGFGGKLNGNNCEISNLTVYCVDSVGSALFAVVASPKNDKTVIENLTINSINEFGECGYSSNFVALNVCASEFIIKNCVNNSDSTKSSYVIFGSFLAVDSSNTGQIINCVNNGNIKSYTASGIGNANLIHNCINNAIVESLGINNESSVDNSAYGIGGSNKISNCINYGDIISPYTASGIGRAKEFNKCANYGAIIAEVDANGIASSDDFYLTNCFNSGSVSSNQFAGGIIGKLSDASSIINSYNRGTVEGTNYAGGLVGYEEADLSLINNFNLGSVSSNSQSGGIVGGKTSDSVLTYNYNYYGGDCPSSLYSIGGDTSKQNYLENISQLAKTEEWFVNTFNASTQIWSEGNYAWDFAGVWGFRSGENDGCPVFVEASLWTDTGNKSSFLLGDGTESNPYIVSSAEDLAYIAYTVNYSQNQEGNLFVFKNSYFKQTSNIDLSDHYWVPIGKTFSDLNLKIFAGNYDGGNFVISGLKTLNGTTIDYYSSGLFGVIGCNGNNIKIENINLINSEIRGNLALGGIAGYAFSLNGDVLISNCKNYASIESNNAIGDSIIGGIIGSGNASIINCYNYGDVKNNSDSNDSASGGIAGNVGDSIINCFNNGNVIGINNSGGIVGKFSAGKDIEISNCFSSGEICAAKGNAGGIIGQLNFDADVRVQIHYCISESIYLSQINSGALIGSLSGNGIGAVNISYCYSISKNANEIDSVGENTINNLTIDKCVYLIILDNGNQVKKYIGNNFIDFTWINNGLTPMPKVLSWVGEIQTAPSNYEQFNDWVLQKMIDEGWQSVSI